MAEHSRLEKLLEQAKKVEAQIAEEKAKVEAEKVLNSIGADVATVVVKSAQKAGVDIKVLHGKFFALTVEDGKLTVAVATKARTNGKRTTSGNGNGNGNYEYFLKDGRGPFAGIQEAMDAMGLDKAKRPTHTRYERLSKELKSKIEKREKPAQPAQPDKTAQS